MNKSRKIRWAGHVPCMEENRVAYRVSVKKPEGKRQIGLGCTNWIHVAQDRDQWWALVNIVMNLRVSTTFWKILE
jgi:hypothetical protein